MILRRFDPLSCSLKKINASMNKTKDQIFGVSSHDLYWENKMYKRKRSISTDFYDFTSVFPVVLISIEKTYQTTESLPNTEKRGESVAEYF